MVFVRVEKETQMSALYSFFFSNTIYLLYVFLYLFYLGRDKKFVFVCVWGEFEESWEFFTGILYYSWCVWVCVCVYVTILKEILTTFITNFSFLLNFSRWTVFPLSFHSKLSVCSKNNKLKSNKKEKKNVSCLVQVKELIIN